MVRIRQDNSGAANQRQGNTEGVCSQRLDNHDSAQIASAGDPRASDTIDRTGGGAGNGALTVGAAPRSNLLHHVPGCIISVAVEDTTGDVSIAIRHKTSGHVESLTLLVVAGEREGVVPLDLPGDGDTEVRGSRGRVAISRLDGKRKCPNWAGRRAGDGAIGIQGQA